MRSSANAEPAMASTHNSEPKRNGWRGLLLWVLLALLLRWQVIEPRWIPSGSMLPTLQLQDRILVEKITPKLNRQRHRPIGLDQIVVFAVPMLDKFKIDDVVGAIPVHLLAGIWGTFIVPFSNPDMSYGTQILGIVSIGVFTFVVSGVIWFILMSTVGIRATEEQEMMGMDMAEVGVEAYPEFTKA